MINQFTRTELLLGKDAMERLAEARVAVFGIGGVGGYAVEALVRSGIGAFTLIDHDKVSITNLNRQIIATEDTIGKYKVDVMRERIHSINPQSQVETKQCFFLPDNADEFDFASYTYIVDAVDTVSAKLEIIERAKRCNIPVISSMGAGNKLDPTKFRVADIYETSVCPLARVVRRECKKRGIGELKVVYSTEECIYSNRKNEKNVEEDGSQTRKNVPGSVAFVPSVAGLILAGEVIKDIAWAGHEMYSST